MGLVRVRVAPWLRGFRRWSRRSGVARSTTSARRPSASFPRAPPPTAPAARPRPQARANGVPLRVSGISPGLVDTEFFEVRAFGDAAAAAAAKRQISKCLEPADVARAVLGCLSAPAHVEVNDVVIRPTEQLI